jgi:hypothetical protein
VINNLVNFHIYLVRFDINSEFKLMNLKESINYLLIVILKVLVLLRFIFMHFHKNIMVKFMYMFMEQYKLFMSIFNLFMVILKQFMMVFMWLMEKHNLFI